MRFLRILKTLRVAGACVAIVYHDVEPYSGTRVIDRLRRSVQLRAMRNALDHSDVAIFTIALEKITWLRQPVGRVYFIPVGANLPVSHDTVSLKKLSAGAKLSIAVFGVTGGAAGKREIENIAGAVRFAVSQVEELRLIVLGRHSNDAQAELKKQLDGTAVELHVLGVLPPEDVARALCISDLLLFVRGPISTRRGSAIAGIACGLPVVAFSGAETAPPITEAGLALYSPQRKGDLGDVLLRVLKDEHYRASLSQQSWLAQAKYFSWRAIATRYVQFMRESL